MLLVTAQRFDKALRDWLCLQVTEVFSAVPLHHPSDSSSSSFPTFRKDNKVSPPVYNWHHLPVAQARSPTLDQVSLNFDRGHLHVPLMMLAGVHTALLSSDWAQDPGSEVSVEESARKHQSRGQKHTLWRASAGALFSSTGRHQEKGM